VDCTYFATEDTANGNFARFSIAGNDEVLLEDWVCGVHQMNSAVAKNIDPHPIRSMGDTILSTNRKR